MAEHPSDQPDLFGLPSPSPERAFDGATYDAARDFERLDGQLGRVFRLMRDGHWRTLTAIKHIVGGSDASVSARLRDLRKGKYGSHQVERRHITGGVFAYRLQPKDAGQHDTGRTSGGSPQATRGNTADTTGRRA